MVKTSSQDRQLLRPQPIKIEDLSGIQRLQLLKEALTILKPYKYFSGFKPLGEICNSDGIKTSFSVVEFNSDSLSFRTRCLRLGDLGLEGSISNDQTKENFAQLLYTSDERFLLWKSRVEMRRGADWTAKSASFTPMMAFRMEQLLGDVQIPRRIFSRLEVIATEQHSASKRRAERALIIKHEIEKVSRRIGNP